MALSRRAVEPAYGGPRTNRYQARGAAGPGGREASDPPQQQQQQARQISPQSMQGLLQMLQGDKWAASPQAFTSSGGGVGNVYGGTLGGLMDGVGGLYGAPVSGGSGGALGANLSPVGADIYGGLMGGLGGESAMASAAPMYGGVAESTMGQLMPTLAGEGATSGGSSMFGGLFGGGSGGSAGGSMGSAAMSNPWSALIAAAALSAGSLSKGHDKMGQNWNDAALSTFGGEGWGGPPMMMFQKAFDGDWKGASRELGGTEPTVMNPVFTLAGGGSLEDVGKNMVAPAFNLKDIGKGSNPFLDVINVFSSPWMARK